MTDINIATTSPDPRDAIDVFADGAVVDPAALDRALADADGRAYFVDLLALRGAIRSGLGTSGHRAIGSSGHRLMVTLAVAASVAIVAAAAGYFGGVHAGRTAAPVAPTVTAAGSTTAPPPTTVIRFERGVDWTERYGG